MGPAERGGSGSGVTLPSRRRVRRFDSGLARNPARQPRASASASNSLSRSRERNPALPAKRSRGARPEGPRALVVPRDPGEVAQPGVQAARGRIPRSRRTGAGTRSRGVGRGSSRAPPPRENASIPRGRRLRRHRLRGLSSVAPPATRRAQTDHRGLSRGRRSGSRHRVRLEPNHPVALPGNGARPRPQEAPLPSRTRSGDRQG